MSDESWHTNVQWKNTSLCMDFECPSCEGTSHFDGYFAHHVQCPWCKDVFKMPTDLIIVKVHDVPEWGVLTTEVDDQDDPPRRAVAS